jgi:hypothetical protein
MFFSVLLGVLDLFLMVRNVARLLLLGQIDDPPLPRTLNQLDTLSEDALTFMSSHLSGISMIFDAILTTGSSCHATAMSPGFLVLGV